MILAHRPVENSYSPIQYAREMVRCCNLYQADQLEYIADAAMPAQHAGCPGAKFITTMTRSPLRAESQGHLLEHRISWSKTLLKIGISLPMGHRRFRAIEHFLQNFTQML